MRTYCKILRLSVYFFALLCFPSVGYASPPSTDVHFCLPLDLSARDSLYVAQKQTFDLNVGEPRTVRMIYFLPNDRPFQQEVVDSMKVTIRQIQTFYAEQMQAHGHGNKTFRFETDAQGEPMVHRVDGQHPDSHYLDDTYRAMFNELEQVFNLDANIYFIILDNSTGIDNRKRGGGGSRRGKNGGFSLLTVQYIWAAAHELGHAFGLKHDFRDNAYIMSYGSKPDRLSACNAEYLAVHPYFNPDIPIEAAESPTIELLSPPGYPPGSQNISIQLKVSDMEGLHQVILFLETRSPHSAAGFNEIKACRGLDGEQDIVVEFDYDGVIPSDGFTSLSNPSVHPISVEVVDMYGDVSRASFELWQVSPYQVATLEEHTGGVNSVAFSPHGTILASGSHDHTVRLWDVAIGKNIATLEGHTEQVRSVVFSPDGTMLVSTAFGELRLWDVATRTNIVAFKPSSHVYSAAFSPDGSTLAYGVWSTVKLWDVATRTNIATLEGHTGLVSSVGFSPDGTTLVSGSHDHTVRLWDVTTEENIAILEGHTNVVWSVGFSPDGTTLVSGSHDHTVRLWDVTTEENIAILEGHTSPVYSVAFSPDGKTLASGPYDITVYDGTLAPEVGESTVHLWDIATRQNIAALPGHTNGVTSVAFLPYGTTLASGSEDGKVLLWDVSEYVTPVVYIPDANLRAVIRDALKKSRFAPITVTDMASLTTLDASNRNIRDLTGLESATNLTELNLTDNPLSPSAITTHIPALQERGVEVLFDKPTTLVKISDGEQEGVPGAVLGTPLVVEVRDQDGNVFAGATVAFVVTAGDGALSVETTVTDSSGQAESTLTLGNSLEPIIISVMVEGIEQPVTFLVEAMATPDFDRDGAVGFADFLLFVAQFGFSEDDEGYEARFDLNGDGIIGFGDFLIFVNNFGKSISSN